MRGWLPAGISGAATLVVFAFLAFWQASTAGAAPTIRYVATFADGGRDVGDCSLAAAPCETPQFAHDRAVAGDEIRVAAGTYTKTNVVAGVATVLQVTKAITVQGGFTTTNGFASANPATHETILLPFYGSSSRPVSVQGAAARISGFTITGGRYAGDGGGIFLAGSTPIISNNTIRNNRADPYGPGVGRGGGIFVASGAPQIIGNHFHDNLATGYSSGANPANYSGYGGALFLNTAGGEVRDNRFTNNEARGDGSFTGVGGRGLGGAIYVADSTTLLVNNVITNNLAAGATAQTTGGTNYPAGYGAAGGIAIYGGSPRLEGGLIANNTAIGGSNNNLPDRPLGATSDEASNGYGGGIVLNQGTTAVISNVQILSNTATGNAPLPQQTSPGAFGGGIFVYQSVPTLDRLVIAGNSVNAMTQYNDSFGGAIILDGGSTMTGTNIAAVNNTAKFASIELYNGSSANFHHLSLVRSITAFGLYHRSTGNLRVFNSIFAQNNAALVADNPSPVTIDGVLWHGNVMTATNTLNVLPASRQFTGDPRFAADLYHIQPGSAAVNRAQVIAGPFATPGQLVDIDGTVRGGTPDLGAHELIEPASASISGPATGQVGVAQSFTVNVLPANTTGPLTYTWGADDQGTVTHVGGASDSVSFTWTTPGTKTVGVVVTNGTSELSASTTIVVSATPGGGGGGGGGSGASNVIVIGNAFVNMAGP